MRSWIKRWGNHPYTQAFLARVAAAFIRLAMVTSRWTVEGPEHPGAFWKTGQPFLICSWHEHLLLAGHPCVQRPLVILASAHRDGQIIAAFLRRFGMDMVYGSTGRKGSQALRALLRCLRAGTPVAIATDGPRGPRHKVQPGIVGLARLTGLPVVPFAWSARHVWRLGTWDKMMIPRPFTRGVVAWGAPLWPGAGLSDDTMAARLEEAMMALMHSADYTAGAPPCPA